MKVIGTHIPPEIHIFLISIIWFFSQAHQKVNWKLYAQRKSQQRMNNFVCKYHGYCCFIRLCMPVYIKYSCYVSGEVKNNYRSSSSIAPWFSPYLFTLRWCLQFCTVLTGWWWRGITHFAKIENAQTLIFRSQVTVFPCSSLTFANIFLLPVKI